MNGHRWFEVRVRLARPDFPPRDLIESLRLLSPERVMRTAGGWMILHVGPRQAIAAALKTCLAAGDELEVQEVASA